MKQIETTKDDIDQIVQATKVNYPDGLFFECRNLVNKDSNIILRYIWSTEIE